jgi:hypothetical protein
MIGAPAGWHRPERGRLRSNKLPISVALTKTARNRTFALKIFPSFLFPCVEMKPHAIAVFPNSRLWISSTVEGKVSDKENEIATAKADPEWISMTDLM